MNRILMLTCLTIIAVTLCGCSVTGDVDARLISVGSDNVKTVSETNAGTQPEPERKPLIADLLIVVFWVALAAGIGYMVGQQSERERIVKALGGQL